RGRDPQPGFAAEKSVLALEIGGLAFAAAVPSLAPVLRAPDKVWPAPAIVIDAQQQCSVGELQYISAGVVGGFGFDLFRGNPNRLPSPAAVGRAVQKTAGDSKRVADVLREQVPGHENRAVFENRQIRL